MIHKRVFHIACALFLLHFFSSYCLAQDPTPNPEIDIRVMDHDYGDVKIGQTEDWVLRIANRGLGLLYVYDITSDNPDFFITSPDSFPQTLPYSGGQKRDTLYVTIAFSPSLQGASVGTLTIINNDADEGTLFVDLMGYGAIPEIEVSETSHDFGEVLLGDFASWDLTITNIGPVDLYVTSLFSDNPDFILSDSFPDTLTPGASLDVAVVFEPSSQGPAFGTIAIHNDDADHPIVFISVAGVGTVPQPDIDLSSQTHNFGNLLVGETQNWELTISNTGLAALTVHSIDSNNPDFSLVSPVFPQTILAGNDLAALIAFTPSMAGVEIGTLYVSSDDPDEGTLNVVVTGIGVAGPTPDIELSTTTYNFGSAIIGSTIVAEVCVSNLGTAFLVVDSIVSDNAVFTAAPTQFTVSPGGSSCFLMRFSPAVLGVVSGSLTLYSNDPDESQATIFVSGNGVPVSEADIQVSATSHDYGDVLVGTSTTWTFTVTNAGILGLTLFSVTSNHANFTVMSPVFPQTLLSGQSLIVEVAFEPSTEGLKAAALTIYSNDPDEEIFTITLTGTGVLIAEADILLSEDAHDFGSVMVGSSANWTLVVTNVGSMPLTVESVLADAGGFSVVSPAFPQILGAGNHVDVVVSFQPASIGSKSGQLVVASNDPDEGVLTVPLSGVGMPQEGPGPDISLSALSYDYGTVTLGSTKDWVVQVYNMGTDDLEVTSIVSDNSDFTVSYPSFPQTIPPSGHVGVVVTFAPSSATYITGALTIHSNDPDEASVSVFLSGSGVPGEGPDIDLLQVMDFGGVTLGSSADGLLTVCNVGSDSLLVFSMDTDLPIFEIVNPTFPVVIPPSGCIEVTISFTPDSPEPVLGHATISSNDPDESTISVTLTGRGISEGVPDIALSAMQHDYRFVMLGSSADWVLDIHNEGSTNLTIQSIISDYTDFVISSPAVFPQIVSPGSHLLVVVTFTPSSLGALTGNLSVESNDPDEGYLVVALSGRGVLAPLPDIEVSEASHDFGDVIVGTTVEWNMIIFNWGSDSLRVYSVTAETEDYDVIAPAFPQKIGPNDSLAVVVTFTPSAASVLTDQLTIVSDDPDEDEWTLHVDVVGTGILVPDIALTKMRHDFGEVSIGHFSDWELWVYNFGSDTLKLFNAVTDNDDFSILFPPFPQNVLPGEHIHVVVSFTPTSEGLITGGLTLTSNDPDEGTLLVTLMGEGLLVPTPDIALSSVTLDFESVAVGESVERTFIIQNVGTADLIVYAVVSEHVDFELVGPTFPSVIGPSGEVEVTVRFAPSGEGVINGSFLVNSNDPDEGSITVYGTGVALPPGTWFLNLSLQSSNIVVAPVTLGIGAHPDGSLCFDPGLDTPSPPPAPGAPFDAYIPCIGLFTRLATEIQNSDSTTLVWTIQTQGTGGVLSWDPQHLPREGLFILNDIIDMRYRNSMDFFSGSMLTIVYTKLETDVEISTLSHDFGDVKIGKSRDWHFSIKNSGEHFLIVNDVFSDVSDFQATFPYQFPQAIAAGESLEVVITFEPSAVGEISSQLTVATNDLDEPYVLLNLLGLGIYPGAWMVGLNLQSSHAEMAPILLNIGIDPEGSNDFDVQLDQPSPPAVPGAEFDAYFPTDGLFPKLSSDIRSSYDLMLVWRIVTVGTDGTISWDPSLLPPDGSFTLNETMNMRFLDSFAFGGGDTLTIVYRVEAIAEVSCSILLQGFYTMGNQDSVVVELRDTRISIAHTFKVLPDVEGNVQLPIPEGSYYVVVSHRNHLAVMTDSRYTFAPGVVTIDFTAPGVAYKPDPGMPDPMFMENDGKMSLRGGDANGDGVVNILDFALFAQANGATESPPSSNWDRRTDFDGNRVINIFDFQVFAQNNGMVTYIPFWSPPGKLGEDLSLEAVKTSQSDPVDFSFAAGITHVRQGEEITVDILLTPSESVTVFGLDAYVQYDPDVFDVPMIEDLLSPTSTFGWVLENVNATYDTTEAFDTLYAIQYSKGTVSGPGWALEQAEIPYRLTFHVKENAPLGETELTFRPQFANVIDDLKQDVTGELSSITLTIGEGLGVTDLPSVSFPSTYDLNQNYPNPFNPETEIRYQLPKAGSVKLEIYNVLGQKVVTLFEGHQAAGYKRVTWDGRNTSGIDAPSGIYFCRLTANHFVATRKMVLTK